MKILVLGGTGLFGRLVAKRLRERAPGHEIALAGRSLERTRRVAAQLDPGIQAAPADWADRASLVSAMRGHDLVLNLAAPYTETLEPGLAAAIEAGVDYCDILGEALEAELALAMHERAREAGVTACIGMGHFPGLTNLFAKHALAQLDEPRSLDVGVATAPWTYGDPAELADQMEKTGRFNAGLQAMIESLAGPFPVLRGGRRELCDIRTPPLPVDWPGADIASASLNDSIEHVTLKTAFPSLQEVRRLASMISPQVDELYRRFAKRLFDRDLEAQEALVGVLRELAEMRDQTAAVELPSSTLWVRATGTRAGAEARVTCRPTGGWAETTEISPTTETLCTAALWLLDHPDADTGVFAPESLFEPLSFLAALAPAMGREGGAEALLEVEVQST